MDSRKTGFDMLMVEGKERNYFSRKPASASKEQPVDLSENSARIVTVKSESQGVESKSIDLAGQQKSLDELSVEEQILRVLGEISDDECDSSPILNRRTPVAAKRSALCRKRRFSELSGEASDVDDLSSTCVKGFSKPSDSANFRANKKESGFLREWRLTEIDVDVQHRRREKMTGPSRELYKSLFSVDPFQLKDFDAVWESFVSREVSCGISDYRPSMASTVNNWI